MGTHVAQSCPLTRCKHLALLTLTQGKHSTEDGGTGNDHPQPQGLAAGHRLCLFGGRIFLTAHWPPLSAGKTGGDWTPSAGAACSSPNLCSPAAPSTSPVPSSQGKSRPPYFWWGVFSGSSGQTPVPWEGQCTFHILAAPPCGLSKMPGGVSGAVSALHGGKGSCRGGDSLQSRAEEGLSDVLGGEGRHPRSSPCPPALPAGAVWCCPCQAQRWQ